MPHTYVNMTKSTYDESKVLRTSTGKGKGQFAGLIPTAPANSVTLVRPDIPKTQAKDALDAAVRKSWDMETVKFEAAEAAVREAVRNSFPNAAAARFTPVSDVDGYDLGFDVLLDDDGNELVISEDDYDRYDALTDELDGIGDVFTDPEYTDSTFGMHEDGLLMNLRAGERSKGRADADLAEIESQTQLLAARKSAVSVEAIALSVRERLPAAQTVHFQYTAFHNQGLTLVAISDAEGTPVWEMKDWSGDEHFTEANDWRNSFNKYVSGINKEDGSFSKSKEQHFGVDLDLGQI